MAALDVSKQQENLQQSTGIVRGLRWFYWVCAALLAVGVITQVFLAGATLLAGGGFDYLDTHRSFAHLIELVVIVLMVAGLFTRLPWRVQGLGLLFFLLMSLQYVFLYGMPALGLPVLRALHAVNALAMFWLAVYLTRRTWQLARQS